jgi:hypothetical protein
MRCSAAVLALIERGYLDAVSHDCVRAGCVED